MGAQARNDSATPPPRIGRRLCAVCFLALFGTGCALPSSPTMATVPREWRRANPWGPQANAARAEGKLIPLFYTQEMAEWAEFGRRNIQDGDILFRYGQSYKPYEIFTSRLIAGVEDNRFSHDGIAHWEGDTLTIYDAEPDPQGIRKIPFEFWVLDVADHSLVIKRLRPDFRCFIPKAIAYCEEVYQKQVPFDDALQPDDRKLYCSELIEKAYRSAGVVLSEPLPITCFPHYHRWMPIQPLVTLFTPIRVNVPVFALGNPHYGTFGSPLLETAYEQSPDNRENQREPPTCRDDSQLNAKPAAP
jgi:Permuted papain-like amidase enzyme, YaeF/YiiX, C92 family